MDFLAQFKLFAVIDAVAVGYTVFAAFLIGWLVENQRLPRPSVSILMRRYRHEWMREMVTREPRIFDSGVMDGLRQGITFYASACMLAIGGGLALVGNAQPLQGLANELALTNASEAVLKIKVVFVLAFVVNAFLKFVWSHRLFGYCSIMMAAVPNDPLHPECYPRAEQAAEINITAARNYNRGLNSVYFALGALGWMLGPLPLLATSTFTMAVLLRREFASASRQVILRGRTAAR